MKSELDVVVVGKSSNKTLAVLWIRKIHHRIYGKFIKIQTKIQVHNENNLFNVGDRVKISKCSPFSRSKSWRVVTEKKLL